MECALVSKPADGPQWVYEIKLDGYRAIAVKSEGKVTLFSKRRKSFNRQFPQVVDALADLPDDTVVDGEVVAMDESGRPNFNMLQNFRTAASNIHYFVFDLLIHKNRDLTRLPLIERRGLMRTVLKLRSPRVHISDYFETSAADMLRAVREQRLEGVVAKRKDSIYAEGKRTGVWIKYRVNRGQEFVIGGYIPGPHGLDSIIVGYYKGQDLIYVIYVARVRNGFVPASRRQVFGKLRTLAIRECPFVNLPETRQTRWTVLSLEGGVPGIRISNSRFLRREGRNFCAHSVSASSVLDPPGSRGRCRCPRCSAATEFCSNTRLLYTSRYPERVYV